MSESEIESEFVDARPETQRLPGSPSPSATADKAQQGGGGEEDLVFLDAAADSGLDIQVVAPAAPTSPKSSKKSTSAKMRTTSARHRVSGVHERVNLGATQDEWSRRERSADDRKAALERLKSDVRAAPRDESYVGRDLGPFSVKKFVSLQRGAYTYLAADEESSDPVLLRVFPFKGTYAPEFKALAERSERVTRVPSPFLNVVLASGRTKECFFVGSELPLGETLEELLKKGETFDQSEVCSIIEQVARGLKVLHARELHHGGISPKTIRREHKDVYVLEDAGICRARPEFSFLSGGGEVVGEPGYLAPEAVDSGVGSPEGDLYALGCVAWTLLAGRPVFDGPDPVQILLDQLNGEVPWLLEEEDIKGVSEGTALIVKKLTGYTPVVRYRSVSDLNADLKANLKGQALKPFPSELRSDGDTDTKSQKLDAGTLMLLLLLVLDLVLAGSIGLSWARAKRIHLEDPVSGYELPMPGVTDGGYRATVPGAAPSDDTK